MSEDPTAEDVPSSSSLGILIVDDEPMACEFLETFLGKQGYEVSKATTGNQALELIQAERPHLVLLDIRMPDAGYVFHGLQLAEAKWQTWS